MKKKYIIYFEPYEHEFSHEQALKSNLPIGKIYLVDEITGKETGDDWDDAPADCNAGSPYPETCKGLVVKELKLGDIFYLKEEND